MVDAQRPVSQSPANGQTTQFSADAGDDWPARASATVVQYVGTVRDKTTGPALVASRNVVYFVAIGLIAFVATILFLILTIRMLVSVTAYLPFVEQGESWMAYLILGGIFLLAGIILWRKKEVR